MDEYIKTIQEAKYYGSDLNKYIQKDNRFKRGSEGLVVNNIDLILHGFNEKPLRFREIEYKHLNEKYGFAQKSLLKKKKEIFDFINDIQNEWILEIYLLRGNYPFDYVYVKNLDDILIKRLTNNELVKWINWEIELNQI